MVNPTPPQSGFLRQLFEDDNGRASMSRLLSFLSFFVSSRIVWNYSGLDAGDVIGIYGGIYVLGYLGGKGFDAWRNRPPTQQPEDTDGRA